ncbi:hypothetical protein BDV98DRAFT_403356 [Pterulicium gracile]|uniref:Uncharacterized protein n=1 Tax=Pterulicium gracile TaxID=1884261 RepID=A0A5C3QLF2_9AGAR|nr:hypothetical protein BDV98DRAFT_403356 [Pterula gracilis]
MTRFVYPQQCGRPPHSPSKAHINPKNTRNDPNPDKRRKNPNAKNNRLVLPTLSCALSMCLAKASNSLHSSPFTQSRPFSPLTAFRRYRLLSRIIYRHGVCSRRHPLSLVTKPRLTACIIFIPPCIFPSLQAKKAYISLSFYLSPFLYLSLSPSSRSLCLYSSGFVMMTLSHHSDLFDL